MKWVRTTCVMVLVVALCGAHTAPLDAKPVPVLPDSLKAKLQAYLMTPAWQASRADELRVTLAPELEQAGFEPEQLASLVRQVFPYERGSLQSGKSFVVRRSTAPSRMRYPIFLPKEYTPDTSWPLHITLHGGGGHDGFRCQEYWPRPEERQPWILMCPSAPAGRFQNWGGEAAFLDALHDLIRTYNIDPERISIGGLSTGATASWVLSAKHPGRWRALVSRSGGPLLSPLDARAPSYANLRPTPALVLHGARDDLIRVGTARGGVEMLKKLNLVHEYWEAPLAGHITFSERNRDIIAWIVSKRRAPLPRRFTHVSGRLGLEASMLYWLYASANTGELKAEIKDNAVTVSHTKPARRMVVFLPEPFLKAPNAPITVTINGVQAFQGRVRASMAAALASYWKTFDHTRIFTRAVTLEWVDKIPAKEGAAPVATYVWKGESMR